MSVRRSIPEYFGIYFITFTCARWLHLFEMVNGYDLVYDWFDYLKLNGHYVIGYVTMPNHVHSLIGFRNTQGKSINTIVGNGKRFISYGLVQRLQDGNDYATLNLLNSFVNLSDKRKGKLHEAFEPSFDWKDCSSEKLILQKLDYIHNNPCQGSWQLATNPWDYIHSSARFYLLGEQGVYEVLSYSALQDIDLSKPLLED